MSYIHINNLYKDTRILQLFRRCFALEKIHGASAHITHKDGHLTFFAGGASYEQFVKLFDEEILKEKLSGLNVTIYGEAYGGKLQGMSKTYGPELRFIAFDVFINENWLSVPKACKFVTDLGLEFVDFCEIECTIEEVDKQRDRPSVQAIRNGMGEDKEREGIVLRPLEEFTCNNGARLIVKHKNESFSETKTPRKVSPEKLQILTDANAVAEEWVTETRLQHILDKIEKPSCEEIGLIIKNMLEDIQREGEGEIVWSKEVEKAIGRATAFLAKKHFAATLEDEMHIG